MGECGGHVWAPADEELEEVNRSPQETGAARRTHGRQVLRSIGKTQGRPALPPRRGPLRGRHQAARDAPRRRSCAARTPTRASRRSAPTRPGGSPGVAHVFTFADLERWMKPLPLFGAIPPGLAARVVVTMKQPHQLAMCRDEARHVGEIVAMVLAVRPRGGRGRLRADRGRLRAAARAGRRGGGRAARRARALSGVGRQHRPLVQDRASATSRRPSARPTRGCASAS